MNGNTEKRKLLPSGPVIGITVPARMSRDGLTPDSVDQIASAIDAAAAKMMERLKRDARYYGHLPAPNIAATELSDGTKVVIRLDWTAGGWS